MFGFEKGERNEKERNKELTVLHSGYSDALKGIKITLGNHSELLNLMGTYL